MAGVDPITVEALDPVLTSVICNNQEKVLGWLRNEPGCWGFLAGKAVAACRQQAGRPLTEPERRLVWSRLWWWLENIKQEVNKGQHQ
jgi:hypothetical protein